MKIALNSEGKLVGIGEVTNGLKCKCTCLECGENLIARNRGWKRAHNFAHQGNSSCGSSMTWLHRAAQSIVEFGKSIALPSGGTFEYNEAKCESAFDGFVADVSIKDSCRVLLIEVVVSNDLDDNKIAKIKCSGLECIRIDLSDVDREVSIERLRTLVTEDFKNRMWVHDLQELSPSPTPFFIQKDQGEVTKQENEEKQTKETESYIDLFEVFLWALLVYLVMKKLFGAVTNSGMGYPRSGYSNPKKTRR